jgi:hypothetical protein
MARRNSLLTLFKYNCARHGLLVPGQEALCQALLLAGSLENDEVAAMQLHDLYHENGMPEVAADLDRCLEKSREQLAGQSRQRVADLRRQIRKERLLV